MPGTKRKGKGDAWYFEVTIGTDFTGKPIRYNKTFHGTEKEADKALARFYIECEDGKVHKESKITISELCDIYTTEYVDRYLKISARRSVDPAIKIWIRPLLGNKKISKLKRLDVQKWVNYISDPHDRINRDGNTKTIQLSSKTVKNYYSVLRSMLAFAIDMGIIAETPCKNIKLPRPDKHEADYYTIEEVTSLLEALQNTHEKDLKYKTAIYIALFGGLRKAEIMGLNWDDINFDTNALTVRRTRMIRPGKGIYEDTPKTNNSNRTLTLPIEIMDMLRKLRAQQLELKLKLQDKYKNSSAVFQGDLGQTMYPQNLQRWFSRFLKNNNLRHIGLHALRHTHASMLAYLGTDKMQVSMRLGHSQLSTTLNIYTHMFENADKNIADNLSYQFFSKKST